MRVKYQNMKIQTKIMLMYILVLCFSIAITIITCVGLNGKYAEKQIGDASAQTVEALKGNLMIMFENIEQFSNMIYFDNNVQGALKATKTMEIDPIIFQTIQESLINMLLSADYIESVFVFDQYNNSYSSKKIAPITVNGESIKNTNWYEVANERDGEIVYVCDTEGVIEYPTRPNRRGITLIRAINNASNYDRLALLLININENTITEFFNEIGSEYGAKYCIVDSSGNYVVWPVDSTEEMDDMLRNYVIEGNDNNSNYDIKYLKQDKYCVIKQEIGIEDWSLIGLVPIDKKMPIEGIQKILIILFICVHILAVLICSLIIMRWVFRPIFEIEKYMANVENAVFTMIPVGDKGKNEILNLKRGFNSMVHAIVQLLEKVKEEEKALAGYEFELLQAQINPHFLYNTLDAISALALTEQYGSCFKMTQALGLFYRNSLNSGKKVVTVRDELECVRNYITILNIRYDNKIELVIDVQDELLECDMLKLVLQPIVENAVYHGLRKKNNEGKILISGYICDNEIVLSVKDDGVGMSEEQIEEIILGKSQKEKSGFGLYGEIQRLSLFYNIESPIIINSEIGIGTEIMICLKMI